MTTSSDRPRTGREIASNLADLTVRASQVVDVDPVDTGALKADVEMVDAVLLQLLSRIAVGAAVNEPASSTTTSLVELAVEAAGLEKEWRHHRRRSSACSREYLSTSLSRLRELPTHKLLFDSICREACRGCGSDRVLLARVSDVAWIPWDHFTTRGTHTRKPKKDSGALPLHNFPSELALIAEGHRAVTVDGDDVEVPAPVRDLMSKARFTIAPITSGDDVFGLIYAAHAVNNQWNDRPLAASLQTFATAVGHLTDRLDMLERVQAQHEYARESIAEAERITNSFNSDIDLVRLVGREQVGPVESGGSPWPTARPALQQELTSRERDVMALLARGYDTNTIAEELAIASSTVKSHLQNILRKAGAVNRSELIARYYDVSLDP